MNYSVQYGTTKIEYQLIYMPRKTLAIDVNPDLSVVVKAPEGSQPDDVAKLVLKRGKWIMRQMREFETYLPHLPPRVYESGETHRYLGKQYRLKVVESEEEFVKLTRGRLFVYVQDVQSKSRIKKLLDAWYRRNGRRVFIERLEACYPRFIKYDLPFPDIEIRLMKTRWGSCTVDGKILLNLRLMQVPKHLIDYVIVHELCHLKEHNHGPEFYALLTRIMPDWNGRRQQLNEMDVA